MAVTNTVVASSKFTFNFECYKRVNMEENYNLLRYY